MLKKALLAIYLAGYLLVTAVGAHADTSFGKFETLITDATKKEVLEALISGMASWDSQLLSQDNDRLVFGKRGANVGSSDSKATGSDNAAEWRFTYYVFENPDGIKVTVNIAAVINPGKPSERAADVNYSPCTVQSTGEFLENLKTDFSVRKALKNRGKIGIVLRKVEIFKVIKNSPAEKAGLLAGDIILKVDGKEMTGDIIKDTMRISGTPGSRVLLLIKRNGKELSIPVVRGNP